MRNQEVGYKRERCRHRHRSEANVILDNPTWYTTHSREPVDLSQKKTLRWHAATWCQMLHICLIQWECCPRTASIPTWQINTREMPGRWLYDLYLESCHKPWHLISVSDMKRGFHCELCHWSDCFSPNESFSTSDASDKSGVVSDKVVKIKQ